MRKRKDGRYVKRVTFENGTYKDFYGKSEKEVLQKLLKYNEEQEKGVLFKTAAEEWRAASENTISYYTYECYRKPLTDVIERFGNRYIKEITPHEINAYILAFSEKGYARQTVKLRLIVLNRIFKYSIGIGYLNVNPADNISIPKNLKKERRTLPSDEDLLKIQSQPKTNFELLAYFILYTGCRRGEALAVEWQDINFDDNTITINKQVQFQSNKAIIVHSTKSESGIRTIPMLNNLRNILLPVKKNKGLLFSKKNQPYTSKEFRNGWGTLNISATPHQLRHAYATILYNAEIDAKTAQSLLGHSSIAVTLDIYTHISKNVVSAAADKLNQFINN